MRRPPFLRIEVVAVAASVILVGCAPGSAPERTKASDQLPTVRVASAPQLSIGQPAWVSVSVVTLWRSSDSPRRVDAPALGNPARIGQWLTGMTLSQRRGLSGRADTQALFGDRLRVVGLRNHWAEVVVPSQPSPLDGRGYPGWVPRLQLTASPPPRTRLQATVVTRTAWLLKDRSKPNRLFPISFGTRLPVVGVRPRFVRVVAPGGVTRRLARATVVVHARGEPALVPSRASLVRTAKTFLGLPYLWAGVSGFGLDCSGLTWLVYRAHGISIPRDAAPQSQQGRAVAHLRRGDLMFYATDGLVHHVSMYLGDGMMIHAPGTGHGVKVVPTSTLSSEYAGARRYYTP
jgi:gamma-D-glutamyl-L-lysine dipeptidyl-peptidase